MQNPEDMALVREFAAHQSETAFETLVTRHLNIVYSAALRQVGDLHLAEEVTQRVFILLARKAGSLRNETVLAGWLFKTTRYTALAELRARHRRQQHETEAFMETSSSDTPAEVAWTQIAPLLDEALAGLNETDRRALLLRYFEGRTLAEVGAALALNEDSARKRVDRGLEKLRTFFTKRGVSLSTKAITGAVAANAVQSAPVGLALTVKIASLAAAGTGTFSLLSFMSLSKLSVGLSALVAAGATTALVVQHQSQVQLHEQNAALQQQFAQLQTDDASLSNRLALAVIPDTGSAAEHAELIRLRGEVGVLRRQAGEAARLLAENQARLAQAAGKPSQPSQISPKDLFTLQSQHTVDALKYVGLAMYVYSGDHQEQFPTNFTQIVDNLKGQDNFDGTNFEGNIPLESFELVKPGSASKQYPQMIMLRERVPRQKPDGTWERLYGLADGSVQTQQSPDGNFDAYEQQQQQYAPPAQ